jgi:hypothetical protein
MEEDTQRSMEERKTERRDDGCLDHAVSTNFIDRIKSEIDKKYYYETSIYNRAKNLVGEYLEDSSYSTVDLSKIFHFTIALPRGKK